MQPVLVAPQPARRLDFGKCFESRHFDAERPFEKSDLACIRPEGVDPVHPGGKCLGFWPGPDSGFAGMKTEHADFPVPSPTNEMPHCTAHVKLSPRRGSFISSVSPCTARVANFARWWQWDALHCILLIRQRLGVPIPGLPSNG